MAGTECLQGPDFHLSETLATKLSLTTKWLLGNQRIRTYATSMHLVFNHVAQLQEVGDTHSGRLVEHFARLTIKQVGRAESWQTSLVCPLLQVFEFGTVENRCGKLHAETLAGSTKDSLENLTEVHT